MYCGLNIVSYVLCVVSCGLWFVLCDVLSVVLCVLCIVHCDVWIVGLCIW